MRLCLVLLVVLATSSAHADSIKIDHKAYTPGTSKLDDKSTVIKGTVEVNGKQLPLAITNTEQKTIDVLEVKGDTITKEKVTYTKHAHSELIDGKERAKPDPLDGKAFTLTAGTPIAVDPAADADDVRKAEKHFGKPDGIRIAVGSRAYTKGKPVDIAATAGSEMFGDDADVAKFALEYVGMDGKNAKFNLKVEATTKGTPAMKLDLAGTVIVDPATAEALDMNLSGSIKSVGSGPKIDGTMTLSSRTTVTKPKR